MLLAIVCTNTTEDKKLPPIIFIVITFPPHFAHLSQLSQAKELAQKDDQYFAWLGENKPDECLIFALM